MADRLPPHLPKAPAMAGEPDARFQRPLSLPASRRQGRLYSLSPRQMDALWVIQELFELDGEAPSFTEIARELDVPCSWVHHLCAGLKNRGWIDWLPGQHRSLVQLRLLPWPPGFDDGRPALEVLRLA